MYRKRTQTYSDTSRILLTRSRSFGAFFIAVVLDVFFYGIVSTQGVLYLTRYTK